ncbi:MAG: hypothetical protein VX652_01265, partial [Candidatus Thermoplasmatota archaeon]|nr:hypothetical protein [Candidatus Thermoplasmatota archaeon]
IRLDAGNEFFWREGIGFNMSKALSKRAEPTGQRADISGVHMQIIIEEYMIAEPRSLDHVS